jgi:poly-gamma-glutamate synthesis protein (capsule biosynthesis protein)
VARGALRIVAARHLWVNRQVVVRVDAPHGSHATVVAIRALVFGVGVASSGIPETWAASANRPGVHYVEDLSPQRASELATTIETRRRPGDIVIVSIHWGGNWGYGIPPEQRSFAHRLVDEAGVDIVHGHSSHHAKGIEVYHERLILYGCGDFLNDYEGIGGREQFRSDLVLLYVVKLHPSTGSLLGLTMLPFQIRRFRLRRPPAADVTWMKERIDSESRSLGCRVQIGSESALIARWG